MGECLRWVLVFRLSFSSNLTNNLTLASRQPFEGFFGSVHLRCLMGLSESASRYFCCGVCTHILAFFSVSVFPNFACSWVSHLLQLALCICVNSMPGWFHPFKFLRSYLFAAPRYNYATPLCKRTHYMLELTKRLNLIAIFWESRRVWAERQTTDSR